MQCVHCKHRLNPYLLKQMGFEKDIRTFELECPNCRKYNYVNEETYFAIKRDFDMPRLQPINLKLPSELNVIFLSLERCGISWIVKELQRHHKKMFGKDIKVRYEISDTEATKEKRPLLNCWVSVYSVDPLLLLKKPYDKIIIVQRPWNDLKWAHIINFQKDITEQQRTRFLEKAENEYKLIYEQEVNDPRVMKIKLKDLNNNYAEATFDKLQDFLNFPTEGRPSFLPVNDCPDRNWEVFSTVLDPTVPLGSRLAAMDQLWELNKNGFLQWKANQLINPRKVDLSNIVIIGPGFDVGCHISENLFYAFKDKGYNVELLPLEKLGWNEEWGQPYKKGKMMFPLSKALEYTEMKTPELVFIDEPEYFFYNDLPRSTPVFYAQREFKRPPKVFYPDIAFFWHQNILGYFRDIFAKHWAAHVQQLDILPIAFNPKNFTVVPKIHKGISYLAGRESVNACFDMRELTANGVLVNTKQEILEVIKTGIPYFHDGKDCLDDLTFREYLAKCEATWCHMPVSQFTSRRMIEAMALKTICVMKLENEAHESTLKSMGLLAGEHYVKITDLKELKELNNVWDYSNYKDMAEKAYNVVMKRHTYSNRADYIIELYKDWVLRKKGVIAE